LLKPEVLMRVSVRDVDVLDRLDRYGFLTQYETGSSNGMSNLGARYTTEVNSLGANAERLPLGLFPRYGYLNLVGRPGNLSETPLRQYGNVIFTFKPDVQRRSTFHVGDSLFARESFSPLTDARALAEASKNNPRFFEAQIWGPLSLDDVNGVLLDGDVDRQVLERLTQLANRYGFSVYRTTDAIVPNQTLPLRRELVYAPPAQHTTGPGFRPLDERKTLERLRTASEKDLPTLVFHLTEIAGPRNRERVASYLHHGSESVREAALVCLSELDDPRAREALTAPDTDIRMRNFLAARLAPRPVTNPRSKGFDIERYTQSELGPMLARLDPSDSRDASLLATFAAAKSPSALSAVANLLVQKGPGKASRAIERLFQDDVPPDVPSTMLEHFETFPPSLRARVVELALHNRQGDVRAALARALGRHDTTGAFASSLATLEQDDQEGKIPLAAVEGRLSAGKRGTVAEGMALANAPQLSSRIRGVAVLAALGGRGPDQRVREVLGGHLLPWELPLLARAAFAGLKARQGPIDPTLLDAVFHDAYAADVFTHVLDHDEPANHAWVMAKLRDVADGKLPVGSLTRSPLELTQSLVELFKGKEQLEILERMATSGMPSVEGSARDLAIQTLTLLGTPPARQALTRLKDSAVPDTRAGALSALAALGAKT
jgi:hypothetical protein